MRIRGEYKRNPWTPQGIHRIHGHAPKGSSWNPWNPCGFHEDSAEWVESTRNRWGSVNCCPLEAPRFIHNKANPDSQYATLQVKVEDTLKASVASQLLKTSVSFIGVTRRCLPWTVSPTARQCSTCLKWGHTAYVCKARFPACDQCAGPHLSSLHDQHVLSCKEKHCSHYGITCANCNGSHHASSMTCPFFKARSSPGELSKLQKARVERLRRRFT